MKIKFQKKIYVLINIFINLSIEKATFKYHQHVLQFRGKALRKISNLYNMACLQFFNFNLYKYLMVCHHQSFTQNWRYSLRHFFKITFVFWSKEPNKILYLKKNYFYNNFFFFCKHLNFKTQRYMFFAIEKQFESYFKTSKFNGR